METRYISGELERMSDPSTPLSSDRPARRAWLAAVPFALAWMVAAGVLDGALAPPAQGGPQIDEAPAAQPTPPRRPTTRTMSSIRPS
jgi:hypothetical protein